MDNPLDLLRRYNYSIDPFLDWLYEISMFQIDKHGVYGYLFVALAIFVVGLFFKETRHMTTLFLSTIFRGVVSAFTMVFTVLIAGVLVQAWRTITSAIMRQLRG